jgi:hypothetical protein
MALNVRRIRDPACQRLDFLRGQTNHATRRGQGDHVGVFSGHEVIADGEGVCQGLSFIVGALPSLVGDGRGRECASLAIRYSGAPASIKAVQRLLGHKTASMTLEKYGHLYDDDLDEVARTMGTHCVYPQGVG